VEAPSGSRIKGLLRGAASENPNATGHRVPIRAFMFPTLPGPAVAECAIRAGAELVLTLTACYV